MRNVPEPDLMRVKRRREIRLDAPPARDRGTAASGATLAATARAAMQLAGLQRDTPQRPTAFDHQGADRRIRADDGAARLGRPAIACVIAPMPPIAWPHTPGLPLTSPKQWCSST